MVPVPKIANKRSRSKTKQSQKGAPGAWEKVQKVYEASEPAEKTISVTVNGKVMTGKQASAPTGVFPVPSRVRRWAGFKD